MVRPAVEAPTVPPLPEDDFEDRYAAWGGQGMGTRPEFIVFEWLTVRKRLVFGIDFYFQSSRWGGRMTFGGVVIDFYFPAVNMVWRVMGERFHLLDSADRMNDQVQKMALVGDGFTVVDLWVEDLETRPDYTLERAWVGQEVHGHYGIEL